MTIKFDEVIYTTEGSIARITLDRPDMLNAISGRRGGTRDQILLAIESAEADLAIGCIVLAGNGRSFCGGGDLTGNARRETIDEHREFMDRANRFHERIAASTLPIIAAVHGHCLGAGVLLATACDLVVASDDASFGFPEGRMGLVGVSPLTPVVGTQWAKFLMLTGESVDAKTAQRLGLVLSVEPRDELIARVTELATRIARMPREGVHLNRQSITAAADAAGAAAARAAAVEADAHTLDAADRAAAPDGRTFRSIIDAEGIVGLKSARLTQYSAPWCPR